MQKEGFRSWLSASHSQKATTNRVSRAGRVERALEVLGLPHRDLDEAYEADRLTSILEALRTLVAKARSGERPPSPLVQTSTQPDKQLISLMNAIQNYVRYRDGKPAEEGSWPALEQLKNEFLERVPEFERFTKTDNDYEVTERTYKDDMITRAQAIAASDATDADAGHQIYDVLCPQSGPPLRWQTIDAIHKGDAALAGRFDELVGQLARSSAPVTDAVVKTAEELIALRDRGLSALTRGEVLGIVFSISAAVRPSDCAFFKVSIARQAWQRLGEGPLFRSEAELREDVQRWLDLLDRIHTTMRDDWKWEPRDLVDVQGFLWTALSEDQTEADAEDAEWLTLFDVSGAAYLPKQERNQRTGNVAYRIKPVGASNETSDAIETNEIIQVARALLVEGRPVRIAAVGSGTGNYLKFPGKLVAYRLRADIAEALGIPAESGQLNTKEDKPMTLVQPTNLILYGPPGTGKTYATAEEALRLCGETVPDNRDELMKSYHRLAEAGRIEFVTFHQNYAYEEFVEGLRPVQKDEETAGFQLQPEPGVFRRIARRAETSTGSSDTAFSIGDRQVFKMSIGRANDPEDAYLFEEAVENGYALLGFDDLDWTDARYSDRDEIIGRLKVEGSREGEISAYAGRVQSPDMFRNWMKRGDLIIVSKGNSLFRAIGEAVGDYEFNPRPEGTYAHRRAIRWLWVDRTGLPVEEIYSTKFTMKAIYLLSKSELNVPALERYVESQRDGGGEPDQFVLIIDEINRANISKVLGELITLLEPDKRIGGANEVRIRLPYSRDTFGVPSNLHIVGTMNTADRSIALLDTALRRRFQFKELPPRPDLLEQAQQVTGLPLVDFLRSINDRIEYLLDREHRIGHAYFINCQSPAAAHRQMRDAVIPLLQEYFFEDLGRVAAVLGEGEKGGNFLACRSIADPFAEGEPRKSWSVLERFEPGAYERCLRGPRPVQLVQDEETDGSEAAA